MLKLVLFLAAVGFVLWSLIDLAQTPAAEVSTLPKPVWALAIILFPLLGSVAWLLLGTTGNREDPGPGGGGQRRPLAPDDDPDFLRRLDEHRREHPDGSG